MRRRDFVGLGTAFLCAHRAGAADSKDSDQRVAAMRADMERRFPFPIIDVPGQEALATWEKIKAEGRSWPIVLGDKETAWRVMEPFADGWAPPKNSIADEIAEASSLKIPDALLARRRAESEAAHRWAREQAAKPDSELPRMTRHRDAAAGVTTLMVEPWASTSDPGDHDPNTHVLTPDEVRTEILREVEEVGVGPWPAKVPPSAGLSLATDIVTGKFLDKARIALVPTEDWTTIPALMRWGDWNDCPAPALHIAALRSWRDRYGAELVGFGCDTVNLRVRLRPQTRPQALDLAREQYAYCSDIVDQGVGTLSALAAGLMADDWWFFWWD